MATGSTGIFFRPNVSSDELFSAMSRVCTCVIVDINTRSVSSDFVAFVRSNDIALLNKSSQSYGAPLAIWDHTVLPSTLHSTQVNSPRLTPARQAGTEFLTRQGWKAELSYMVG